MRDTLKFLALRWLGACAVVGLAGLSAPGCGDSDEAPAEEARSQLGESCETGADCANSLICIQNSCRVGDYTITPAAKECVLVECRTPADCCSPPPSFCVDLEQQCNAGDTIACDQFARDCVCNSTCANERCVDTCTDDAQCFSDVCDQGSCVDCRLDTDCPTEYTCRNNECIGACASDYDCPVFYACNSGACTETGCTTDRECVAYTHNVLAKCIEADCAIPCQNDADCGSPMEFNFKVCVNEQCVDVGCETDAECRARMPGGLGGLGGQNAVIAECRDK